MRRIDPSAATNRMTLSRLHVPVERVPARSDSVNTGPPEASTRLSLPSAMNAMCRPSADQNGLLASSVPASGRALALSSGRTHKTRRPAGPGATSARCLPSGERARPRPRLAVGTPVRDSDAAAFTSPTGGRIRLR